MTNQFSTISICVSGRVQGVWFRASTKNVADKLMLKGFVKNLPDGKVYIEASGVADSLDALVKWCHQGPELARVNNVKVHQLETRLFDDFQVQR